MKQKISILLFLVGMLLCTSPALAQKMLYAKNTASYIEFIEKESELLFQPAANWVDLDLFYVTGAITKEGSYNGPGRLSGPIFKADPDADCLILMDAIPLKNVSSPRYSIYLELRAAKGLFYGARHPKNQNDVPLDFHEYVTVLAGHTAREMFNADTLFFYDMPNIQPYYFHDEKVRDMLPNEYTHSTNLTIMQVDGAVMRIKLLFTEEGWQERDRRLREVENSIRFKERPVRLDQNPTAPTTEPGRQLTTEERSKMIIR
ncbi:MAG: hypothetical protein GX993_05825 [Bacteroidales bacterium]|nr:hypothetical protein [Bacteroidales bacterium]